jgi:hypothetical protein
MAPARHVQAVWARAGRRSRRARVGPARSPSGSQPPPASELVPMNMRP